MIGDNLSTDIMFGNSCNIDTLLVLSGVTAPEKAARVMANQDLSSIEGIPTYV